MLEWLGLGAWHAGDYAAAIGWPAVLVAVALLVREVIRGMRSG